MNWNILNRPICWITAIFDFIVYGVLSSGHQWETQEDKNLRCEICGKVEK